MKRRSFIKDASLGAAVIGSFGSASVFGRSEEGKQSKTMLLQEKTSGKNSVRVAVVQQAANPGGVEENREKALRSVTKALEQKADVILFHEEMLVGYVDNLRDLAEPVNGATSQAFQKLLKGTDALVIYGLTERDGDDYYIAAPVVSADGVIAHYRKCHLWWFAKGLRYEPGYYKAGNKLVTFDVKGFKSGIMICYDGDFPEMTRSYANLGCSMLFWMNNRKSRGYDEVKKLAENNSMIMPTACCCGLNERGEECSGGSNITGPKGELLKEIWHNEGILIEDVYPETVTEIRKNNPWYTGLRSDVYYYGG